MVNERGGKEERRRMKSEVVKERERESKTRVADEGAEKKRL